MPAIPSFTENPPTAESPSTRREVTRQGKFDAESPAIRIDPADPDRQRQAVQLDALRLHVPSRAGIERAREEQCVEALVLGRGRRGGQAEQEVHSTARRTTARF